MAERLLALPLRLGVHTTSSREITLHLGRFGPYVVMHSAEESLAEAELALEGKEGNGQSTPMPLRDVLCSLPKSISFWTVSAAQASELIDMKLARDIKKGLGVGARKTRKPSATNVDTKRSSKEVSKKTAKKAGSTADKKRSRAGARSTSKPSAAAQDKPKRPRSAYIRYSTDQAVRDEAKRAHPGLGVAALAKVLGAQWKALSDADKRPYQEAYDEEKAALAVRHSAVGK